MRGWVAKSLFVCLSGPGVWGQAQVRRRSWCLWSPPGQEAIQASKWLFTALAGVGGK